MSFENIKASVALLLEQMTHQPEDLHELQESLREKIEEQRAMGQPVPEDVLALEQKLSAALNQPDRA
ncbi:MAG: hypothetical protein AAFV27_12015 [Pseudomonadota bacterium]